MVGERDGLRLLERLRELRNIPEQRDFRAWKESRLALYDTLKAPRR